MTSLPPELYGIIIKFSFLYCKPYEVSLWNLNKVNWYNLTLVDQLFKQYATFYFISNLNLTNSTIEGIKNRFVSIKDRESILVERIEEIFIGERVEGLNEVLEVTTNLKELWIDCSDNTELDSSLVTLPRSVRKLHLHAKQRKRWIGILNDSFPKLEQLSISSTFISPLYQSFPRLTHLSILLSYSCNISPLNLLEIFKKIGPQLINLSILKYGSEPDIQGIPYSILRNCTNLKHFSISGGEIIPKFLAELDLAGVKLSSIRYINSYSEFLPHLLDPLPFCLTGSLEKVGFPIQMDKMRGREGLDQWAKERNVKLIELEVNKGIWQEDLDLLNWV